MGGAASSGRHSGAAPGTDRCQTETGTRLFTNRENRLPEGNKRDV
jgi:hypothetical protein